MFNSVNYRAGQVIEVNSPNLRFCGLIMGEKATLGVLSNATSMSCNRREQRPLGSRCMVAGGGQIAQMLRDVSCTQGTGI